MRTCTIKLIIVPQYERTNPFSANFNQFLTEFKSNLSPISHVTATSLNHKVIQMKDGSKHRRH
jgi:hypothetical protein